MAPQVIENKLKESRYIEQVIVVGENEKFYLVNDAIRCDSICLRSVHLETSS